VDVLHGISVEDPYRWLEDVDSPETAQWVRRQNRLTFGYLRRLPQREYFRRRLAEIYDHERFGLPFRRGERLFLTHNTGLQNQDVLYRMDGLTGDLRLLLDPNTLSKDGTIALTSWVPSDDGRRLAYGLSEAGSDWEEWHVRDVESGHDLPDHLRWVKFSGASWTKDGQGFFYSRYDEPKPGEELKDANYYHKLFYHRLGTEQSADRLIYERPDQKEWGFDGIVTDDGRYLVIQVWLGTERENNVLVLDLAEPQGPVVELVGGFEAMFSLLGNTGSCLYFRTDLGAPRARVITIDLARPEREHWREVIPEGPDALESVSFINGRFLATYLHDAYSVAKAFREDGSFERDIELPGMGTLAGFSGRQQDRDGFFGYTDFVTPDTLYRYETESGLTEVFRRPEVAVDSADYLTEQVFYTSKDGTRVPMFVVRRRGVSLGPETPCLLYGYGGFDTSMTPYFSFGRPAWLELGGAFALANIRGGGEYGKAWHDGGRKLNKQNGFDDFIAAAEWLIANGYTSSRKLGIGGSSNGGLLTGACLTQRPELFGCAWVDVGVLDMLRFDQWTIGWAWVSEYGSPGDPEAFQCLRAYSPYHNLKPGTSYPATLVTTGDHDDRVFPAHSFKFAAALQAAQGGQAPVLIRTETRAGHGGGKPTDKLIAEGADAWAFLAHALGVGE
jgi:prolyl oligopeptidase